MNDQSRICQICHHQNLPGAKFCSECGERLIFRCRVCSEKLDQLDAKFCTNCGVKEPVLDKKRMVKKRRKITFKRQFSGVFQERSLQDESCESRLCRMGQNPLQCECCTQCAR
ncbi:MAG: zinc ribbon domain-containing protein [Clostridiales bacterium]|nr:zinc ribbon domain-containing protein [Candidatus Blautia equi]